MNENREDSVQPAPFLRLCDMLAHMQIEATQIHEIKVAGGLNGPMTGFKYLDWAIGGSFTPGLHAIIGSPGIGKTALALQIAASCGCPAIYVTCEVAPIEILWRHTARATGIYLSRLKSGELKKKELMSAARRAITKAPQLNLLNGTQGPILPDQIEALALSAKGENDHLLIVIDSLNSWGERLGFAGIEYEVLSEVIKSLECLAFSLNVPILFVAERDRENMKSSGKRMGAGMRKIERIAETILDLEREYEAKPDAYGELAVRLKIIKNRHGAAGRAIPLQFHADLQRFKEDEDSTSLRKATQYR